MDTPRPFQPEMACLPCWDSWACTWCSEFYSCSWFVVRLNRDPQRNRVLRIRGLMPTLWFMIVAVMVAAYVVLDGFDLGAGAIYLAAARSGDDRRKIMRAIGPVWDGNEVWLLAAGGTLYFAFPMLYASSFSGFYLPLMMVLWLLM